MPENLLHEWFVKSARTMPDETALVVAGRNMTYGDLDTASRVLAARVREDVPVGGRVGLFAAETAAAYVAYLAVLRSGCTVVPLNVDYPAARIRQIADLAELDAVIADEGRAPTFAEGSAAAILAVGDDDIARALRTEAVDLGDDPSTMESVAYILFTSGSTGVPKGVPIKHRHLARYLRHQIQRYRIAPGARLSQTFGLTFDLSVFDMFVAWGGGGALVVPSRADLMDPAGFANAFDLTHFFSVPSIGTWAHAAGAMAPGSMPSVRYSLFGGEQLTLEQARHWAEAAPYSTIENLYGPTELTITAAEYRLPNDPTTWPVTPNDTVPIGVMLEHLDHRVLADSGELQVRGAQRFDGYLNPGENIGRFVEPDGSTNMTPSDAAWYRTGDRVVEVGGALVHLGRLDDQVKVMGHRLELGDVEAALRRWAGLSRVVAVMGEGPSSDRQLTAVYAGQPHEPRELRERLRSHVPDHMIPARFVHVDMHPLNVNGKIDRQACSRL